MSTPDNTNVRTSEREAARLERRKQMAAQQAQQFEDELSGHELNIVRLESIPEAQRDESWEKSKKSAEDAIAVLDQAIVATLESAE